MERLTFNGFVLRLISSLLLVGLTWNPTGTSYSHWFTATFPHIEPMQALVGLILLAGWAFSVHATWRSLGQFGVLMGAAIYLALVWVLHSYGWIDLGRGGVIGWLAVALLGLLMAAGLCWSLVQRRVTGQVDVEEGHGR
jgi:hypothetical protein